MTKAEKNRMNGKLGGRPKGSTTKPRFSDFLKEGDLDKVIAKALQMALNGNEGMLKLVIEHSLGKPLQPTDITSQGEQIKSLVYLPAKNGVETK